MSNFYSFLGPYIVSCVAFGVTVWVSESLSESLCKPISVSPSESHVVLSLRTSPRTAAPPPSDKESPARRARRRRSRGPPCVMEGTELMRAKAARFERGGGVAEDPRA